ncbi:hypothetical protein COR50_02140 [Chitinophaga caeni]|uniref:SusD-like N-terminal domain-containing protein n=1 Tax=Chitinophaga caeni TaxID=2029983 RepID=A0A291QQ50_9BACT|nr:RagB/SusD family nutrient uptake outer membrane protein [Chitinophaga caeni]ATL46057.1 hypothetical protein COR50_02140 [Chitinophaga caeni]
MNIISKYISGFTLAGLLMCTACSKWLDVKPSTQVSETEQFSSEQGFKDALIGVYQQMAQSSLYGKELTYSFVDILGQNYTSTVQSDHNEFRLATYDYTDANVVDRINAIWSSGYSAIAQVNYILRNIDKQKDVFSGDNYNIIKGEALGLRAYLHFDLLRLFAPAAAEPGASAIPYMKDFTVVPQDRLTVEEVIQACLTDLQDAEELLSAYPEQDQITAPSYPNGDNFLAYRQNHLNYWAVKATMARVYLYNGQGDLAYNKAKEVLATDYFRFLLPSELNAAEESVDRTGTHEHVFSIYVSNLKTFTDIYFRTPAVSDLKSQYIVSTQRRIDLFETSTGGTSSEVRINPVLWESSVGIVYPSKLWQEENNAENYKKRIPLIKLSEMILIAAETAPTLEERLDYLNEFKGARKTKLITDAVDDDYLQSEVAKEYRKDFICEGQLFYFYKRKQYTNIPGAISGTLTNAQYVLPLPQQEIEFGK